MEFNIIVVFIFGLTIGSFLNVLIDRLPKREDVFWGRSRCDFCKKRLRWFELIPL
ncbi:prepilin peptidase, partial [Candidatus Gottesmanbacteria bacterium]|nr:prepilin peptidase [Candidatus Gottesmanbacteria bacterium]